MTPFGPVWPLLKRQSGWLASSRADVFCALKLPTLCPKMNGVAKVCLGEPNFGRTPNDGQFMWMCKILAGFGYGIDHTHPRRFARCCPCLDLILMMGCLQRVTSQKLRLFKSKTFKSHSLEISKPLSVFIRFPRFSRIFWGLLELCYCWKCIHEIPQNRKSN